MRVRRAQVVEVRSVGAEGVLDNDDRQVGMLLAKAFQPAAGRVSFAIVFGFAVLLDDRFGCQGDDFLEVRMDQSGTQSRRAGNGSK